MAGAIMNKVWDLFGMDTERDAEEVEEKTAAAAFTGKIEPEVKKERVKILEKLKKSKIKEFREKFLDTVQKVYIEEIKAGKAYGYTENYLRVEVNSVSHKVADIVEVKIMSSAGDLLKGEVI